VYGLRFDAVDRDRHFDRAWSDVVLELDDGPEVTVPVTDSFWRNCTELRSAEIGRWLESQDAAPWPPNSPSSIGVRHIDGNCFQAHVIKRRNVL
jgi:hypothetical protein